MNLNSPSIDVVARWYACLDGPERAHADRFHFREDGETYIAAHWLMRTALASIASLPPRNWRFITEKMGKPRIDPAIGRAKLQFNLSHTRGFVACAITIDSEIGIDVEALNRRDVTVDIAERFLSPSEVIILRSMAEERKHDTFFRFWTLKEAFIKATGEGLSRPLDSFSFALDPVSISFGPDDTDRAKGWQFIEHRPTPQHLIALAIERPTVHPISLIIQPMHSSA
jgi:4'-phosphopantetheinyl transferase